MDAMQESVNTMMNTFMKRMDAFEKKQAADPGTSTTASDDHLALEFAEFRTFVMASFRAIQMQIEALAKQSDQQEMRGRRKILLLHGVREEKNEETDAVVVKALSERLKLNNLSVNDIARSHRMGRSTGDKPRPILFKLRDMATRGQIWTAKTKLKGSGLTLSEFLTKTRHDAFIAARERFGVAKCWTREGLIIVLGADGSRHRVSCMADLDEISKGDKPKPQPAPKAAAAPVKTKRVAVARK